MPPLTPPCLPPPSARRAPRSEGDGAEQHEHRRAVERPQRARAARHHPGLPDTRAARHHQGEGWGLVTRNEIGPVPRTAVTNNRIFI